MIKRIIEFDNARKWIDTMRKHKCENKDLFASDDPDQGNLVSGGTVGYLCFGCDTWFTIHVNHIDKTLSSYPSMMRHLIIESLGTHEGRLILGRVLNRKDKK